MAKDDDGFTQGDMMALGKLIGEELRSAIETPASVGVIVVAWDSKSGNVGWISEIPIQHVRNILSGIVNKIVD